MAVAGVSRLAPLTSAVAQLVPGMPHDVSAIDPQQRMHQQHQQRHQQPRQTGHGHWQAPPAAQQALQPTTRRQDTDSRQQPELAPVPWQKWKGSGSDGADEHAAALWAIVERALLGLDSDVVRPPGVRTPWEDFVQLGLRMDR